MTEKKKRPDQTISAERGKKKKLKEKKKHPKQKTFSGEHPAKIKPICPPHFEEYWREKKKGEGKRERDSDVLRTKARGRSRSAGARQKKSGSRLPGDEERLGRKEEMESKRVWKRCKRRGILANWREV